MRRSLLLLAPLALLALLAIPSAGRGSDGDDNNGTGGIYGRWSVDAFGLPAFVYTLNELTSPNATWPNSMNAWLPASEHRRDHFHVVGNARVNLVLVDHGYVELFGNERGPRFYNYFSLEQLNLGGGFSYVHVASPAALAVGQEPAAAVEAAASCLLLAPNNTQTSRLFGLGYFKTSANITLSGPAAPAAPATPATDSGLVEITHTLFPPFGDDPVVVDTVTLTNHAQSALDLDHYEYWDVNHHQLLTEWTRTGPPGAVGDSFRDALNMNFTQSAHWDASLEALVSDMAVDLTQTPRPPSEQDIAQEDFYPARVFLAPLNKTASVVSDHFVDQSLFFGRGGAKTPDAVRLSLPGGKPLQNVSAYLQPAMFAMKTAVKSLAPGESIVLQFLYGYVPKGVRLEDLLLKYRATAAPACLGETLSAWKAQLPTLDVEMPDLPQNALFNVSAAFRREAQWRAHSLLAMQVYHDYYQKHVLTQGSAYLFLHGIDGAPRDTALSAMAAVYLDPRAARESLLLCMALQRRDNGKGNMWYAFGGFGSGDEALGLHAWPSDLDIALFLGVGEYISATGDWAFLDDTSAAFHPANSSEPLPPGANGTSVLDHLRVALVHLNSVVGVGEHGLIRLGDGDWDDGIALVDPDPLAVAFTVAFAESIPNSQMALHALPQLAQVLAASNRSDVADVVQELRALAAKLTTPVTKSLGSRWFGRAWMRDALNEPYLRGSDSGTEEKQVYLDLQAQVWPLICRASPDDVAGPLEPCYMSGSARDSLVGEVVSQLVGHSPIGPVLSLASNQVWPAISQLFTWGVSNSHPELARELLAMHLYATHATAFPGSWLGIYAGPDGFNSVTSNSNTSGWTWESPVTPMTDFPVSNSNPEAMFILASVRALLGVQPSSWYGDGLAVNLSLALPGASSSFPLISVHAGANGSYWEVMYTAFNSGRLSLRVFGAVSEGAAEVVAAAGCTTHGRTFWHSTEERDCRVVLAKVEGGPMAIQSPAQLVFPLVFAAGDVFRVRIAVVGNARF